MGLSIMHGDQVSLFSISSASGSTLGSCAGFVTSSERRRRRRGNSNGDRVTMASASEASLVTVLLHVASASIVENSGWHPNTSTDLFLGMLPYLMVFILVPIGLLLVCWCARYILHTCSRRMASGEAASGSCLGRLFPRRSPTPLTPTPDLNSSMAPSATAPATLFTNYTNYNPILEGELDLFPITYSPQPRDASARQRCPSGIFIDLSCVGGAFPFLPGGRGDMMAIESSRMDDPPPRYSEDPPPSYESLFVQRDDKTGDVTNTNDDDKPHLTAIN